MDQHIAKLYVVATPIGNVDDLSLRAKQILSHVTWIAAEDTRHSQGLLNQMGIKTPLISYHDHNERTRTEELIAKLKRHEDGALISDAGTPLISDPGFQLVSQAHAAGIPVIPIPGPCAAITALSASGLATNEFFFAGFLPAKSSARRKRLQALASLPCTIVLYEAPHRIIALLEDAVMELSDHRKACLARELTKKFESIRLSSLAELLADLQSGRIPEKGEFVLMIEGAASDENETAGQTEAELDRVLGILLAEMPLKQAVMVAKQLTGQSKNLIYDRAMQLKPK